MTPPRRRRAAAEPAELSAGLKPEAIRPGRTRVPGLGHALEPEALPPGSPSLDEMAEGLRMLEEVISEGDALARSVALCLLALLIDRLPTRDLQDDAEDMLASFLADDPVGPELMATIGRLRGKAMRHLH